MSIRFDTREEAAAFSAWLDDICMPGEDWRRWDRPTLEEFADLWHRLNG